MKFLVDNALSPSVARDLQSADFIADHVRDHDLQQADDETIFEFASNEGVVIITADTDFSLILSQRRASSPSLIIFRGDTTKIPDRQANLLKKNIPNMKSKLKAGCVAIIRSDRIRLRDLPIYGDKMK